LRRTCISLWLTPWVVLRAISRNMRDDKILTGPADHCRNNSGVSGKFALDAPYYAAAINPDGRHDENLAPHAASRLPTRQEFPGSFFETHPDLFCWRRNPALENPALRVRARDRNPAPLDRASDHRGIS
jgi:hypothetical protein